MKKRDVYEKKNKKVRKSTSGTVSTTQQKMSEKGGSTAAVDEDSADPSTENPIDVSRMEGETSFEDEESGFVNSKSISNFADDDEEEMDFDILPTTLTEDPTEKQLVEDNREDHDETERQEIHFENEITTEKKTEQDIFGEDSDEEQTPTLHRNNILATQIDEPTEGNNSETA
jgi:hypothetical protein